MRRWTALAAAFCAGLAALAVGFRISNGAIPCRIAEDARDCPSHVFGEELVYAGFVLVALALLSALVTLARRS